MNKPVLNIWSTGGGMAMLYLLTMQHQKCISARGIIISVGILDYTLM